MNLTAALRARRSGPSADELEQALLRFTILSLATLYVLVGYASRHGEAGGHGRIALAGLAGWWVLSLCIVVSILVWPSVNVPRRVLGTFVDVGVTTFALIFMGEAGAVLLFVYLFVTFGNGIRYGRRYLQVSQLMAVGGFSLVLLFSDFWSRHLSIGVGVIILLIILPLYVGTLTERLVAALKMANEANQAKSDRLLAYVSHRTGEPLNAIIAEYNENTRQEG